MRILEESKKERGNWKNLDVDGSIILKLILREM
jgi:hypothetical protein